MMQYLYTILYLIYLNSIILKIFFSVIFIYGIKQLRSYLYYYIVTIDEMRVKFMVFYILNTILFVSFYVCILGYWRFLNISKKIDLKIIIFKTYFFIKHNDVFDTMLIFICTILFIFFLYYLFIFLKSIISFIFLSCTFLWYILANLKTFMKRVSMINLLINLQRIAQFSVIFLFITQ